MDSKTSTILPPFSGELKVDQGLNLSHGDFKQSIEKFYKERKLSTADKPKQTPTFPTPHVLAQFASMAYKDCQPEKPEPPAGWKFLTTAYNSGERNGYFGVAYWHPEHQQVVIAHRGTVIKPKGTVATIKEVATTIADVYTYFKGVGFNYRVEQKGSAGTFVDVYTDIKGVVFNYYVEQMSSASTFANKVVKVLQEMEQQNKVSFELFFTGHSLGGWLAQITSFTTEYLEAGGGTFLKNLERKERETVESNTVKDSNEVQKSWLAEFGTQSYHPHTTVFDSPGCKDMLSQMADKLDVRYKGRSVDLQHLDITSYLSAPNLINTCNSHLGTVYRIFTDLSKMTLLEKRTVKYNLATHGMDRILQAFDPETGQVLKIQEVVDWPIREGLIYGAELNQFFEWAEHINDYHPEVKDIPYTKQPAGYNRLRYQTTAYNGRTKSQSVFTQNEREFLEGYLWLRHVTAYFKPEDLFCVMKNAEAEKEAEQMLRDFNLSNGSVSCPDSRSLHEFVPYVKWLVRNFRHINEEVKYQLTSPQIRNKVFEKETERYAEKIRESGIKCIPGALGLREFLDGDQQICQLRLVDGDARRGLEEVYWVLETPSCDHHYSSDGRYTMMELERLLTVKRMINLNALLAEMETPHLLMIACGNNQTVNGELSDMFRELFSILKQKNSMKIILTAQSECEIAKVVQEIATETFGFMSITTGKQLTWSDLTAISQKQILEKTVIFQGKPVALNQLTTAQLITGSFPVAHLLQENELRIGEDPVLSASSGYNEKYYIDRTFNQNIVIKQDIASDKRQNKFPDLLASNEQEFEQLCQQNPTSNVHWLVEDKSGELVWKQSKGNLKILREYIDDQKTQSYAPSESEDIMQRANYQRYILIADTAGMGKTTVLTHLSKRIKQTLPKHWLVRIDLNDYAELFKAQKGKQIDEGWLLELLSDKLLKLGSQLEKELFKKSFEGNKVNKLVVMLDGFDEISPHNKETVIEMVEFLKKQTSVEQLWVTTRPHLKGDLEDSLQQLSYTLRPFSEIDQVQFLENFWAEILNLVLIDRHRLQMYARALIKKLAQSISDKDKEFTGIPLQTHMIAEAFVKKFKSFYYNSEKSEPEIPQKLDLLELYSQFINRKIDIYIEHKSAPTDCNSASEEQQESFLELMEERHELLALQALFDEDQVTFIHNDNKSTNKDERWTRLGIAQRNVEGKPHFIHLTFAEFYVANFLIKQLQNKTIRNKEVQNLLLNEVLLKPGYHVIRAFLDGLLRRSKPPTEVLKHYGKKLDKQWNVKGAQQPLTGVTTALFQAAVEDNANIIGFIVDSLKSAGRRGTVTGIMLARDDKGRNAWFMAGENRSLKALEKIWEWVKEVATTPGSSLLLSKNQQK